MATAREDVYSSGRETHLFARRPPLVRQGTHFTCYVHFLRGRGTEVWLVLTAPGAAPPPLAFAGATPGGAYRFVALSTRGSLQTEFTRAQAGQTGCYALRYVTTTGAVGPWSEIAQATVTA